MSVKVRSLATRSPPMKWSGETSTAGDRCSAVRLIPIFPKASVPTSTVVWPPSTGITAPFTYDGVGREQPGDRPGDLLGRARPPQRHVLGHGRVGGLARARRVPSASISSSAIGVRTQPGQTQFARTPAGPWSSAMHCVSIASAAFEEQYARLDGAARKAGDRSDR